ncbi:hypothetical protein EI555_010462, partial [Monodon monoceros]
RTLRIEKSTSKEPVDFEQWIERDLVHTEGQLQNEEIMVHDGHATYLRFIIVSAFDHFASEFGSSDSSDGHHVGHKKAFASVYSLIKDVTIHENN